MTQTSISSQSVLKRIFYARGKRVMLDRDLAELYGVPTKHLTRQVRRNGRRFPADFMFRLTKEEFQRCQIGTFGTSRKGSRKYLPYVFTEQGVAMLSGVLHSTRAIRVNIQIMRTFIKIREMMQTQKNLWKKIRQMEDKYDGQFKFVFDALRGLLESPLPRRKIGFHP
jgi:hypothetical protein